MFMDYFFAKFQKAIDGMLECASHAKQTLHSAAAGAAAVWPAKRKLTAAAYFGR